MHIILVIDTIDINQCPCYLVFLFFFQLCALFHLYSTFYLITINKPRVLACWHTMPLPNDLTLIYFQMSDGDTFHGFGDRFYILNVIPHRNHAIYSIYARLYCMIVNMCHFRCNLIILDKINDVSMCIYLIVPLKSLIISHITYC